MKLIGSKTSPYVRRLRLLLHETPHEFIPLDIYNADREQFKRITPTLRVPVLIDGELTLYESRVIQRYLQEKLHLPRLSWAQENLLSIIDNLNDSLVILVQAKRSKLAVDDDIWLFNLQRERIIATLNELEEAAQEGAFRHWQYPSISLYCLLDWARFHDFVTLSDYPALQQFHQQQQDCEDIQDTASH